MKNATFCIYAVDDDDDDRVLIETALKAYSDCEVTFFSDGEALLAELSTSPEDKLPTLILLDLDMPRVNGYEVLESLRTSPTLRSIPVLVLSGTRDEQTVRKAYELGANAFMSKPNTFLELNGLLQLTHTYWLKTVHTPKNP
ncbi:response regulator [Spirosoma flavum]|uniref:Response regulator n=1 Tax=Spirosoma flavum TaxID=2048557 RepID=A0ABW6ALF0_9BACT